MTCDIWDTDYNTDNWEPGFMTIFVTWQLIVTLDSIRNSCDVLGAFPNTRLLKTVPEKDCLETVITPGRTYQITGCAIFFAVITGKLEGRFFCGGGRLSHKKCVARPHQTRLLCLWKHQPDRPIQMNETRSVPLLSLLAWFQWAKAKTRLSGGCGYGKKKK